MRKLIAGERIPARLSPIFIDHDEKAYLMTGLGLDQVRRFAGFAVREAAVNTLMEVFDDADLISLRDGVAAESYYLTTTGPALLADLAGLDPAQWSRSIGQTDLNGSLRFIRGEPSLISELLGVSPFSPESPDDWSSLPESVQSALNQLAGRLATLEAGGGSTDLAPAVLLAGRAGGQTIHGGTGANQQLVLMGTSNAAAGEVICQNPFRAPAIVCPDVSVGDLKMKSLPGRPEAYWILNEAPDGIDAFNMLRNLDLELCIRPKKVGPVRRFFRFIAAYIPSWI